MAQERLRSARIPAPRPLNPQKLEEFERFCEALADGILVSDGRGTIVAANRRMETLSGYRRQELIGRPVEFLVPERSRSIHEGERRDYYANPHLRMLDSGLELFLRRRDGTELPVDIGLSPVDLDGASHVVSAVRDATERHRVAERLSQREAILGAVAYAANRFLRNGGWETHIEGVLSQLGEAAEVGRVSVYIQHEDEEGRRVGSHRHEWCAPGIEPQIGNPLLQNMPIQGGVLDRWADVLGAGELLHGCIGDFPENERTVLDAQGIRCLVIAPIFADGAWWGNIGFVDTERERDWSPGEMDALRAASDTLGGAVERERGHAALGESESRFRRLAENAQDIVIRYRLAPTVGFEYMSPSVETLTGYRAEEFYADPSLAFRMVHPDDLPALESWFGSLPLRREGSQPPLAPTTIRWVRRDGSIRWTEQRTSPVYDDEGALIAVESISRDVTEQKEAERAIRATVDLLRDTDEQRRALLGHLVTAQEEERARIADDIHDDSIQQMTAASLRLQVLRSKLDDPEQVRALEQLQEQITHSIRRLRKLLFELRPPALDTDGLAGALTQYLDEMPDEDEHIAYRVQSRLADEPPPQVRTIAYRIAQEALVNARKHASATEVSVLLEEHAGQLHVAVRDDGVGFDPADIHEQPGHLGLAGMRKRAELAGGRLATKSEPGHGTTVEFWLPLTPAS